MTVQRTELTPPQLEWFKSSYSTGNGGECLEIAWRKSTHSSGGGGECVEVAPTPTHVHIRDSKQPSGPMLTVGPDAWAGFVGLVAN
ncbi:DUF397 domain-containing protein [Streptomyces niveus]|uniref:DUF397 domain-containing protein n=1 Tax=Streptomyces niveus TaxID=193462 RepID=A0ABZ2A4L8_STRNV|nr:DUF397 domain-containing protein [Streptomyces niveus]WTA60562.1 DUF397 domain-containing protein [Streptomyces niveus]